MFKLTFLAMWLLAGASGINHPADHTCSQVVIQKLGDDTAKTACCPTTGKDTCQKMIIKGGVDCCAKAACCPTTGKDTCQKMIIKGGAGCCAKTACCPTTGKDTCQKMIIKGDADCCAKATCGPTTGKDPCRQIVVSIGGDSGAETACAATALAFVDAGDDDKLILREYKEMPDVWIGVRATPVPEPLASHLKRGGLMIANVAEGSPADQAGVERYDVVLSFNQEPINEMSDLVDAISENGAAKAAKMVVIRSGEEQTLTITPVKRDDSAPPTFKYDEPEVAAADPYVKYFGHRLRPFQGDKWVIEPYGRLDALPDNIKDMLKDLSEIDIDIDAGAWSDKCLQGLQGLPFELDVHIDADDLDRELLFLESLEDEDIQGEITINVSEDGKSISVHRAKDGTIEVERENPDGTSSSATYENTKQLRENDPEAHELLRQSTSPHSTTMLLRPPKWKKLGDMQHEFQIKVQSQLEKARKQYERALDQAREVQKKVKILKEHAAGDQDSDADTRTESVMIFIDDDGHIAVEIKENGSTKKYEFKSREDFKKSEPQLYERFKENLDEADAGAGNNRIESAPAQRVA